MKEIKFRAWDKKNNKILSGEELIRNCIMVSPANGHLINYKVPMIFYGEDFELMQFTGLKDKNGKEIFEGDILRDENDNKFEVYFADGIGAWRMVNLKYEEDCYSFDICESGLESGALEVIGNIYENPELLEEGKE